jgi:hypothetical protein
LETLAAIFALLLPIVRF